MEDEPKLFKRDFTHLRTAQLIARESDAPNFKMGAVIASGKKMLGLGHNNVTKTHPASNTPYSHIHAELAAMLNARTDLTGTTLYVFRGGKNDRPLISKPCKHCQALIAKAGIKTVIFSVNGGYKKVATEELLGA